MAEAKLEILLNAKDQTKGVFGSVGNQAASLGMTLVTGLAAAGAAVAAGLGFAIKSAADFEKTMSGVKAVSGATAGEMSQLSALALQLGKDTVFSASEAASGLEELVKGGVSIPEIMNGAAQATLNLAAAGGVSLPAAAGIAANALNTFGLKGADMARVSDLIAGAANASAISVDDFRMSLAASGAIAATVGLPFGDLAVAIAAMGNAGIKSSDAGTSLKTMLLNLQPSTKEQTALFKELGIITADGANAFFTAEGKAKGLADISGILQLALSNMTDQQRLATLEVMFGSDAIRAAAVLSRGGAEGFNNLAASMSKVTAESVAAERMNNLNGDIKQLTGSVETAAIELGTAFQPALREAAQSVTGLINAAIPFIKEDGPAFAATVADGARKLVDFAVEANKARERIVELAGRLANSTEANAFTTSVESMRTAGADLWAALGTLGSAVDSLRTALGFAKDETGATSEAMYAQNLAAEILRGVLFNVKMQIDNLTEVMRAATAIANGIAAAFDAIGSAAMTARDFVGGLGTALSNIPSQVSTTVTTIQRTVQETISGIGRNAHGTRNWRGGLSWVGEEGPELVNLPRGSQVYSNQASRAMTGGGGVTINVSGNTLLGDERRIAQQLAYLIKPELDRLDSRQLVAP